jgi:hypothetical protein
MAKKNRDDDDKDNLKGLFLAIRETDQFKVFKKVVEKAEGQLNVDDDMKEVFGLHATRTSRKLYGSEQYSNRSLIDASLKDLQARSRMVELRMKAKSRISFVEKAVDDMRAFINTQFKSQMSDYRTKEQRAYLTDRVLKRARQLVSEVEAFTDVVDNCIKDIDQAGFALNRFSEALDRLHNGKGKVL